ncbi:MAG: Trk family potassium uptake protein [Lachnospiraceae bacterium]|nr:Trk family potassium uptake protein [Lachnospiraceae bacterium]
MYKRIGIIRLSSFQIIILGFIGVILAGAILLMLPVCSQSGTSSSFSDALFTAASAVCVTGLVIKDTALTWSAAGQTIILLLIQIGGLGVISVAAFIAMLSGRKISLFERSMLQDTVSAHQIGGVVKLLRFIFVTAFVIEAVGAICMMPVCIKEYGISGIWIAVFHSVSAFCNAGFDLMGSRTGAFSSLTSFSGSVPVTLTISALIFLGGIGFLTWEDFARHRFHLKKYRLQSKVILSATAALILIPMTIFFFGEFGGYPLKERLCMSLFQAITPRTAGFNTADLTKMSGVARLVVIILMLIGASPGSTAGGMKTTTAAVLLINGFSVFRHKKNVQLFGRRIEDSVIRNASTLLSLYLFLTMMAAMVISTQEKLPLGSCVFEAASAIGTVGLSLGITPLLGPVSRGILILLMFLGRVGGLTLIYAAVSSGKTETSQCPVEKIIVG